MRKNKMLRKRVSGVRSTFLVQGLNLDRLIEHVKKQGITLYDVKKISQKSMHVTVNLKQGQKFFAIAKDLCYNIKKVKDGGRNYPLYFLFKEFGLIIGAVIFTFIAIYFNGFIFSFEYSGSGSVLKREVQDFLEQRGIKKYTRFSDIDLAKIEDEILAGNDRLSFVGLERKGNVLKVELALSKEDKDKLSGNVCALYSDVDGVVENIKVYRGTPKVSVGEQVFSGQLLVDGKMIIKEQEVSVGVICTVTLLSNEKCEYYSLHEGEEEKAVIFAEQTLKDKEIISSEVVTERKGEQYCYTVTLKYRRVLYAG